MHDNKRDEERGIDSAQGHHPPSHTSGNDPLDETQLLTPEEQSRIRNGQYNASTTGDVRELPRREAYAPTQPEMRGMQDGMNTHPTQAAGAGGTMKKWIIVGGVFIVALVAGFLLSDSAQEKERARQEHAATMQDLESRQSQMAQQETDLEQQKTALEKKKAELEARERELEKEEARLSGKGERLTQEKENNSVVDNVVDKLTGKEAARERETATVETDIQKMREELQTLRASMQETDTTLQEIDSQLSSLSELAASAKRAADAAKGAYAENEETIDGVLGLIERGANLLREFLTSRQ